MMNLEKLISEAQLLFGIEINAKQAEQMSAYAGLLQEWNTKINLTAIREDEDVRIKHFLDSISCFMAMRKKTTDSVIDVGTGAGFPGLVLKIIFPAMQLTLIESVGKKANFCSLVAEKLALQNVAVLNMRAEEVGQMPEHREKYDFAVARSVANLPVLSEYLLPLVKVGGFMLAQKGQTGPAELTAAEKAIKLLGGRVESMTKITLPNIPDERYLVLVKKTASSPALYPRLPGIPAKKPI